MAQLEQPKRLAKPVDWDQLYPGRFVKASDLKGKQVTLRISEVNLEELAGEKGPIVKGVISFEKTEKMLALNKTNGLCLRAMFGKKVQDWVGKRVTLFPTEVRMPTGEMDDAIRVYGSPDIPRDLEITVSLPRKRPVQMTMHRTGGTGGASASSSSPAPKQEPATPDAKSWCDALKACNSETTLGQEWDRCCAAFANHPPTEVDDVYHNRREQLAESAARQMELSQ